MIQNINAKTLTFCLSLMLNYALNAQQIDTLKSMENAENSNLTHRWARISYGINVGYFLNKSHATGLLQGEYSRGRAAMIGLTLKLNLGKKLSIGTAFNWYYSDLISISPVTVTTEAPSTVASEPNYIFVYEGKVRGGYNVFDLPFEVSYKFNTIKKHYIPIISVGTTFFIYPPNIFVDLSSEYTPYSVRTSGSQPVETEILRPNSGFTFSNKHQTSPFITAGIIWALSEYTSVKLQAKYALNQNSATSILSSKTESITRSSNLYTQQLGLIAEYFVTF